MKIFVSLFSITLLLYLEAFMEKLSLNTSKLAQIEPYISSDLTKNH